MFSLGVVFSRRAPKFRFFSLSIFSSSARSPLNFPDQSPVSSAGFEVFGAGLTGHRKVASKIFAEKKKIFDPNRQMLLLVLSAVFVYFGEVSSFEFCQNSVEIRTLGRIEITREISSERL